jgi:hypothetical protein
MLTPTIRAIAKRYNTKVDFGTDPDYLDGALVKVIQNNPWVNKIINWRDAKDEDYHSILDFTCPCVAYEKPGVRPRNRVDLFADHVGIALPDTYLDFVITEDELSWARDYIYQNYLGSHQLIMVNPASAAERRTAPPEKIKQALYKVLGLKPQAKAIIITHNSDNDSVDWGYANTHVAHNLDVRQLAALMTYCKLVLCPDSAMLHVACALHASTVTLFGPTDPRARVNYHPEAVAIWPGHDLKGYPIWYDTDADPGLLCWKRLEVHDISETMLALMNGGALPDTQSIITFGNFQRENKYYQTL